jgi:L-lactate dehydrogenase complex protein LldF
LTWRREINARGLLPWSKRLSMRVGAAVLRRPRLMNLARKMGRAALAVTPRFLIYHRWNAWGRQRELPELPRQSFRDLYRKRRS